MKRIVSKGRPTSDEMNKAQFSQLLFLSSVFRYLSFSTVYDIFLYFHSTTFIWPIELLVTLQIQIIQCQ